MELFKLPLADSIFFSSYLLLVVVYSESQPRQVGYSLLKGLLLQ